MISEYLPECLLKKMRTGVIFTGAEAIYFIDLQRNAIPYTKHSGEHSARMSDLSALQVNAVLHCKASALGHNHTDIALLAAHGSIEGGAIRDDSALLPVGQRFYQLRVRDLHCLSGIIRLFML